MCISGTALMFPYKAIKDNAQKLSYQFDRKFEQWGWQKKGTAEAKAAARGESMDHPTENKVSWGDLLISRATSIAVAIFAGTVLEKHATGDWFSKIHSKAADKVEPDITFTDDTKTQVKDIKDIVHSRGQNFKHLSLKAGRSLANSLKDTWFGKWRNITATDDDLIAKPSNTEDFTRLIIKEATLTAVLAATMPVVLDALDWMRGKKKNVSPSATITTHTQIKADITIDSKSTAGAAKTAEKELVKEALIDIAEQPKVLKHTDRTAQKPHSDILPRKEQSVDTMAMAGGV
jgi:hypothetical protein